VVGDGLGRDTIATIDPSGEILELAAFAAERHPGCLGWFAPAKDARAGGHGITIDLKI